MMNKNLSVFLFGLWLTILPVSALEWRNALQPKEASGKSEISLLDVSGAPRYRIVLPALATPQESHAAATLAGILERCCGRPFEVLSDSEPQNGPELRVGATSRSPLLLPDALGIDGIDIFVEDDGSVNLQGGPEFGLNNAVFAFLEEDLGYRYWWENAERLPSKLTFVPISRRYTPQLNFRNPFCGPSFFVEWCLRNRANYPHINLPTEAGIQTRWLGFAHTLPWFLPEDEYFDEHPEYFAMDEKGERRRGRQLCDSNPEVAKIVAASIARELAEHPETHYRCVHISRRDGGNPCLCPECQAINDREGTTAATLFLMMNRIAVILAPQYPDLKLITFAYLETREPPKNMSLAPSIIVEYCNDYTWNHPLTPAREMDEVVRQTTGWAAKAPLYIWDYNMNYDHFLMPYPSLGFTADNIRFWCEHRAEGIMTECAFASDALGSERDLLRAWLIAHLMWNPEWDWKKLAYDFITGYFGKAAEPIWRYNQRLEAIAEQYHEELATPYNGIRFDFTAPYFTPAFVAGADADYAQAFALADGDEDLTWRIERDYLPILYTKMNLALLKGENPGDYEEMVRRFTDTAAKAGLTTLGEKSQNRIEDFTYQRPLSRSPEMLVFDSGDCKVVRLDARWKFQMVSILENGLAEDEHPEGFPPPFQDEALAMAALDAQVDDSAWPTYLDNCGYGWEKQGQPVSIGTGVLRQHFRLPVTETFQHWYLVIPGCDEDAWVYLNEGLIAEHTVSSTGLTPDDLWFHPVIAEVTDQLNYGYAENFIGVRIFNRAKMGGIYASVYLVASQRPLTPAEAYNAIPAANPYGCSSKFVH